MRYNNIIYHSLLYYTILYCLVMMPSTRCSLAWALQTSRLLRVMGGEQTTCFMQAFAPQSGGKNCSPGPDLVLCRLIFPRVFFSEGMFSSQTPVSPMPRRLRTELQLNPSMCVCSGILNGSRRVACKRPHNTSLFNNKTNINTNNHNNHTTG